jgi:hypothetical protein
MIFTQAAIVGPIAGLIALYLVAAMTSWTGKWIRGKAPSRNIRAAIAWSGVPIIWALVLWIPQVILFGRDLFTTKVPGIHAKPFSLFMFLGFGVIYITILIWASIVYLKCLGQIQGFSLWKALYNQILALLVSSPIAILAVIAFGLYK